MTFSIRCRDIVLLVSRHFCLLLPFFLFLLLVCYGPYPIHRPTRLSFKKKENEKDFRVLGKSVPKRNGFVWSHHLLFIFIYYRENQVRTKTSNDSS